MTYFMTAYGLACLFTVAQQVKKGAWNCCLLDMHITRYPVNTDSLHWYLVMYSIKLRKFSESAKSLNKGTICFAMKTLLEIKETLPVRREVY